MRSVDETFTLPRGLESKYLTFLNDERFTEMAWLGGFGTSKSDCLITSIIKTGFDYPGSTMVLARDELVNLKRTTLVDLLLKGGHLMAHHNRTESVITWPGVTGHDGVSRQSQLYCFGLMTGDYVQKLKSLQPFRIFIDEGDKILEEMFDMCVLRLRQKVFHRETGKMGKNQVKIVANDEGNNWLWRRFVNKPHPGLEMSPEWVVRNVGIREELYSPRVIGEDLFVSDLVSRDAKRYLVKSFTEDGLVNLSGDGKPVDLKDLTVILQRLCVYAFTYENKSLNRQNLMNARGVSGALREKYILGKVDTQTGLLFPEFNSQVHVIATQTIPHDWRVVVGLDHGFDHPTAAVFLALGRGGELIVFDEYAVRNLSPQEHAWAIKDKLSGYENVQIFADTQMWNVDPRNPGTIADDYIDAGLRPFNRANKNRDVSIARIKDYLALKSESIFQPDAKPRLFVTSNCSGVIKSLHNLSWEDFNGKRNDDLLDALRYAIMAVYNTGSKSGDNEISLTPKPFYTWRQHNA